MTETHQPGANYGIFTKLSYKVGKRDFLHKGKVLDRDLNLSSVSFNICTVDAEALTPTDLDSNPGYSPNYPRGSFKSPKALCFSLWSTVPAPRSPGRYTGQVSTGSLSRARGPSAAQRNSSPDQSRPLTRKRPPPAATGDRGGGPGSQAGSGARAAPASALAAADGAGPALGRGVSGTGKRSPERGLGRRGNRRAPAPRDARGTDRPGAGPSHVPGPGHRPWHSHPRRWAGLHRDAPTPSRGQPPPHSRGAGRARQRGGAASPATDPQPGRCPAACRPPAGATTPRRRLRARPTRCASPAPAAPPRALGSVSAPPRTPWAGSLEPSFPALLPVTGARALSALDCVWPLRRGRARGSRVPAARGSSGLQAFGVTGVWAGPEREERRTGQPRPAAETPL